MSTEKDKATSIPVRIDTSAYEALKQLANEKGMTITDLVSASVQAYMRENAAVAGGTTRIEERLADICAKLDKFLEG
jgi:hypothetical protein